MSYNVSIAFIAMLIIALKDGQVAEVGTPQQLQAQDGIFARRLRAQGN